MHQMVHSSATAAADCLLAFHLRVKISPTAAAD